MPDELPLHLLTPRSCRMARAGLGIYQEELAEAAGVHKRSIKMFETGQSRPQVKTATGIMNALIDRGVAFGLDGSVRVVGIDRKRVAQPARSRIPVVHEAHA